MKRSLRREVLVPARDTAFRIALWGLPVAMAAGGFLLAALATSHSPQPTYVEVRTLVPEPVAPAVVSLPLPLAVDAAEPEPADPPPPTGGVRGFGFVFTAGGSPYMALADLEGKEDSERPPLPVHEPFSLFEENYVASAVAEVAASAVPETYRAWEGRRVRVEGGCEATVTGFAVISRLTGDPGYYAGEVEQGGSAWSVGAVLEGGHRVLAARLGGCAGGFARDASLPGIVEARPATAPAAAEAAKEDLLSSAPAIEAQRQWEEAGFYGPWSDHASIEQKVIRHPGTGETFVSVQASEDVGCGGIGINLWGLYRVDERGQVRRKVLHELEDVSSIQSFLDLDGDGSFELVVENWLGVDKVLLGADGDELERLPLPFFGCAC